MDLQFLKESNTFTRTPTENGYVFYFNVSETKYLSIMLNELLRVVRDNSPNRKTIEGAYEIIRPELMLRRINLNRHL